MSERFEAAYVELYRCGELALRVERALARLQSCDLCAHRCGANRSESSNDAACRTGRRARVSSVGAHHGEEDPLVGSGGSGTVFFSWCNLRCLFCQNAEISQFGDGSEVEPEALAAAMLDLQEQGCHNINLVSPSHVVAQILEALIIAVDLGLSLPLVYNTGGYDSLETLRLLDGVVDIYMPDMKFADPEAARRFSRAEPYPEVNRAAVLEMHRQVGDLIIDQDGVARRGLLVRHLVLPGGLAGTNEIVRFLAEEVSQNTYINVMAQYRPCHRAHESPPLDKTLATEDYAAALRLAEQAGLRLDQRRPRFVWRLS